MLVAIPNVMGILDKNKQNTYIQHGKQMIALAEYKMNQDRSIPKPTEGNILVFSLGCLNTTDIEKGPEGGDYDLEQSLVAITKSSNTYHYYVTLRENIKSGSRGLELLSYDELNKSTAKDHIVNFSTSAYDQLTSLGSILYQC